jgi:hypothetical protein
MCPNEYAGGDVWTAIEAAELFEKGLAPVGGGTLDQAAKFVYAARFVWGEQATWRAALGIDRNV